MSNLKPLVCVCGCLPTKIVWRYPEHGVSYACYNPECLQKKQAKAEEAADQAAIERWNLLQMGITK